VLQTKKQKDEHDMVPELLTQLANMDGYSFWSCNLKEQKVKGTTDPDVFIGKTFPDKSGYLTGLPAVHILFPVKNVWSIK